MVKLICGCAKTFKDLNVEGYYAVTKFGSDGTIEYRNSNDDTIFVSSSSASSEEWKKGYFVNISRFDNPTNYL